jgi:hypothetical protein
LHFIKSLHFLIFRSLVPPGSDLFWCLICRPPRVRPARRTSQRKSDSEHQRRNELLADHVNSLKRELEAARAAVAHWRAMAEAALSENLRNHLNSSQSDDLDASRGDEAERNEQIEQERAAALAVVAELRAQLAEMQTRLDSAPPPPSMPEHEWRALLAGARTETEVWLWAAQIEWQGENHCTKYSTQIAQYFNHHLF